MDDTQFQQIQELVTRLRKRDVSPQQVLELEKVVLSSKAATQLYVQYVREEQSLRWWAAGATSGRQPHGPDLHASLVDSISGERIVLPPDDVHADGDHGNADQFQQAQAVSYKRPRRLLSRAMIRLGFAATVVIGFSIVGFILLRSRRPIPVAQNTAEIRTAEIPVIKLADSFKLIAVSNAQWATPNSELKLGEFVPIQPLDLIAGFAQLRSDTGVSIILEAPARFQIRSPGSVDLLSGKLAARVPIAGHGFAVLTRSARVVDLGTEFGIEVQDHGETLLEVFRGKVQAQPAPAVAGTSNPVSTTLTEGQAADVNVRGVTLRPNSDPQRFVQSLATDLTSLDLVDFINSGDGTTGKVGAIIDPVTGRQDPRKGRAAPGNGQFHVVSQMDAVDGCFVPQGSGGPMAVDSNGDTFQFPTTNGLAYARIWAGNHSPWANDGFRMTMGGVDYSTTGHRAIHIPSNGAITFDLSLLRHLHPGLNLTDFHTIVGNTAPPTNVMDARADVFVLIDGKQRFAHQGLKFASGPDPIDFPLTAKDRFLTLATTDGGDGNDRDWILFADPRFDCQPQQ